MAFKIDILITYADADNSSTTHNNGWVTDFKRFLELMMTQVQGKKPNILLKGEHDSLTDAYLDDVAILIPILSKSFIKSGECLDTLEEFLTLNKNDPPRVFKTLKQPLTIEEEPAKLRKLIGFNLYSMDMDSGETADYDDFFSPEAAQDFWMKMVDLAYDINESLFLVKYSNANSPTKPLYSRRSIYLAETSHDLTIQRNIIKRELLRHGYKVLPDQTLPSNIADLKRIIKKDIEESSLSIHLIGNSYGEIPDGADRSVVDIQNLIASEKSSGLKNKSEFSRLVWITPNLEYASEKQHAFVENIKRDLASTEGAEIMQTPLEDFKNIVREELIEVGIDKKLNRLHVEDTTVNGKAKIYILYDKLDEKEVDPIKRFVEKSGYHVLIPLFKGELLDLRQHHIANLRNLDGAIIFQGNVNNDWVRMKLLDLLKAPGFGRRKPVKGKVIITRNIDDRINLSAYKSHNIPIIDGTQKNNMDMLKNFLDDIKIKS